MLEKTREFEFTFEDFNHLRKLSNEHSGILVPDGKFDMFYSRLSKRLRVLGIKNFKAYCQYLNSHHDEEFTHFINAVTTNLTAFFRENHHFDYLRDTVIPEVLKRNRESRQIKVWSAGCSTGEEPYSLAILLSENVPSDWSIKILATDLDTNVLATASAGIYTSDRIRGLSEQRIKQWFMKGNGRIKAKPELQNLVHFKQLNLMKDWPMKGPFDFIFCRNVLIYFDRETKEMLAIRYAKLLASKAWLFIGHSESLNQLTSDFSLVGNTIYKKLN
ncbi:MAG: protein-glutamate O-methyltransferase [Methylococcaceae bacterium]